jgi:hypothetical protein
MTINKNKKNLTFKRTKDTSALLDELCKIYKIYDGLIKLTLKPLKNNLSEIIVNGELKEDHVVLQAGQIKGGKNTIKYYIIKTKHNY